MPILPPLQSMFDAMQMTVERTDIPVQQAREAIHQMIAESFSALMTPQQAMPVEKDFKISVGGGEITLRVYSNFNVGQSDAKGPGQPCYLYFHGGGFWLGTLEQSDSQCRAIARDAECVVVSVEYRLAPEYRFPTAAEDGYTALMWVVEHAGELAIDPTRIAVGGGSAGGNLAAVVSLMARDRGGPQPVLQILEIPVTDLSTDNPLYLPNENLSVQSGKSHYGALYATPEDVLNPYASPLLAEDLSGLPPALIMVAEYDPLRKEGEQYARRLQEAGVGVICHCWEGQYHGSQRLDRLIPEWASAYHRQIITTLGSI